MTLAATIGIQGLSEYSKANDLSTTKDQVNLAISQAFANGTGNNQADKLFHDKRSLGDGASEDLDLAGSLSDVFGAVLAFVKIKGIIIQNLSTTQILTIGGAAANALLNWVADASDKINIPPGGAFCLFAPLAGFAVTAGTGDILKVANSAGAACDYNIWIIGTSA
jgi:hypothetical protein